MFLTWGPSENKDNPQRLAVSVGMASVKVGRRLWWLAEAQQENKRQQLKQVYRNLEQKIQKLNTRLAEMD